MSYYLLWLRDNAYRIPPGTETEPEEPQEDIFEDYDELGEYMEEEREDKIY